MNRLCISHERRPTPREECVRQVIALVADSGFYDFNDYVQTVQVSSDLNMLGETQSVNIVCGPVSFSAPLSIRKKMRLQNMKFTDMAVFARCVNHHLQIVDVNSFTGIDKWTKPCANIIRLRVQCDGMVSLDWLQWFPGLKELVLHGGDDCQLKNLDWLTYHCPLLDTLNLIDIPSIQSFAGMPRTLQNLYIERCGDEFDLGDVVYCTKLRSLDVDSVKGQSIPWQQPMLDLAYIYVCMTEVVLQPFGWSWCPNLVNVTASCVNRVFFEGIRQCQHLHTIHLTYFCCGFTHCRNFNEMVEPCSCGRRLV